MKATNPKDLIGSNKLPLHLFPASARAYGVLGLLDGMLKYGRSNWRAVGIRASIYYDAVGRHLDAWLEGEDNAPDSGLPHLAHAIAGLAIIIDATVKGNMTDDRMYPGNYREMMEHLAPHIARLKKQHVNKDPYHYTIENLGDGDRDLNQLHFEPGQFEELDAKGRDYYVDPEFLAAAHEGRREADPQVNVEPPLDPGMFSKVEGGYLIPEFYADKLIRDAREAGLNDMADLMTPMGAPVEVTQEMIDDAESYTVPRYLLNGRDWIIDGLRKDLKQAKEEIEQQGQTVAYMEIEISQVDEDKAALLAGAKIRSKDTAELRRENNEHVHAKRELARMVDDQAQRLYMLENVQERLEEAEADVANLDAANIHTEQTKTLLVTSLCTQAQEIERLKERNSALLGMVNTQAEEIRSYQEIDYE